MSMASTSNQTDSSISSTAHCDHDVFLSFRGPDTRNSFTSHLYDALTRSGIRTFIDDDELRSGKEIKPELRKAIQGSRMYIIVFSENYASSRWCLDELVEIIECKNTMGRLVIPLFYHVDPSVVRHQSGSYAEAFQHFVAVLEERKVEKPPTNLLTRWLSCLWWLSCVGRMWKNDSFAPELELKKMDKWRAALTETANLSGHDLRTEENGNEARFISKIVSQLEVNLRSLNVPKSLVIVDSNFNCINTLLNIGSEDVRIIGICGMGGIGKTTVSKDLYYKYLNHFEGSAFIEDIKDVSKQPGGLLGLQQKLLNQLQKKNVSLSNSDEGINLIEKICRSRRVLILLDDLDDFDQIKKLVGQKRWFSAGSRVIIVTRDAKLLKEARVDHTYEMKVLDEDKSLELFRRHAIGEEIPSEDHILLSIDIARYCRGLPLALEVIGSHLRGEDLTYWKNAFNEFQSIPHEKIQDQLKISYDALKTERKKIFLDVACFFIGWKTEYLIKFWDGCGFFADNSIRDLMDKSLLKLDENNCLWMHDHLRDMGRAIVLEASDPSLKKHSRVWIQEEVRDLLLNYPKGAKAVEGLSIQSMAFVPKGCYTLPSISALETKPFKAMHQLRFLLIEGVRVDITGSFGKLRWLRWEYCPLKSLPTDFHPRELVVLQLQHSLIEKLWEGVKHLNNLKILDLSGSWLLVETPNFTGVPSLERLMLGGCKRLSTIDPSIWELRSLEELDLEGCSMLERLPEELGNMKSLKTLNVGGTLLEGLPDSIGQLSRLVHLRLKWCKELKTLPTTIGNLISLEELDVFGCLNLERLPEGMGNLKRLSTLNANETGLEELPDSIGHLSSLVHLDLDICSNLKRLPEGMGNLISLRTLNASETGLEELPDSIGHLSSLVHLDLSCCNKLKTLPDSICDLSSLEVLHIDRCRNLQQLPDRLGNMVSLRNLDAFSIGCQQMSTVILENLKKLESLTLRLPYRGPQFRAFERFVVPFKSSLKRLILINCGLHDEDIQEICILSLQFLDLRGNNFCYLPSGLCQLSNLPSLFLSNCSCLVSIPELPPNLHTLIARRCKAMKNIPNLSNLKRLRYLDLSESNRLVEVQGLENLQLNLLEMAGCNDLAMNTTFNESFFQRQFERPLGPSNISLPKWMDFPNWIIYQSMESTISFELPRSLPDNFQGIILWVVYARFSSGNFYDTRITNNTSGDEMCHYRLKDNSFLGGHSRVSCIKSNFKSGDSITISISEGYNVKVEKCGVHWLIGSEGYEDENVHDGDDSDDDSDYDDSDYYDSGDNDGDGDDYDYDDEEEETERYVSLKRGHDFDLNTEPNEKYSD